MGLMSEKSLGKDLYFSQEHEWVRKEGDLYLIGISDYAQESLGDIVYLDISVKEKENIEKGANFGLIESIKAVEDLTSPIGGEVIALNSHLKTAPEQINQDNYSSWIIKMKAKDEEKDLTELMDVKSYKEYVQGLS